MAKKPSTTPSVAVTEFTKRDYRHIKLALVVELWNVTLVVAFLAGLSIK